MNDESANIYESLRSGDLPIGRLNLNATRCPFFEEPLNEKRDLQRVKHAKRAQRHRSTAQSRLGDMTVGDIRYCFQQLRNAGDDLCPELMLYNGQSAGEFALKYLRETSTAMRKRRKKLSEEGSSKNPDRDERNSVNSVGPGKAVDVALVRRNSQSLRVLEF